MARELNIPIWSVSQDNRAGAKDDVIEGDKFVLLFSEDAAKHIAERHLDGNKPGSLFKSGINLRDVAKKILNKIDI